MKTVGSHEKGRSEYLAVLEEMLVVGNPEECPVCLTSVRENFDLKAQLTVLPCRHAMCRSCAEVIGSHGRICPSCPISEGDFAGEITAIDKAKRSHYGLGLKLRLRQTASNLKSVLSVVSDSILKLHEAAKARIQERTALAVASLSGIKESAARSPPVGLLRAIADPGRRGRVAYGRQVEQDVQVEWTVKCNQSQRAVVEGLGLELAEIQGPPGTGKSQTIVAIIAQRLPQKEAVLVASMQNTVVDAIVTKLECHQGRLGGGFYVLGAAANERIGAVAARFTLQAQGPGCILLQKGSRGPRGKV